MSRFLKERDIISRVENVFNEKEAIYLGQLRGFAELTGRMKIHFTKAWQPFKTLLKICLQRYPNCGEF